MKRTAKKTNAGSRVARKKRGIILLVVLSLLTLFILLGVTYTLIAMSYSQSGRDAARQEQYGDSPETEFDMVLGQVLYGSRDRTSLLGQDMLADLYGSDSVSGQVSGGGTSSGGGQVVSFNFSGLTYSSGAALGAGATTLNDYFTGRVLTFITGSAAGFSTRIVGYDPTNLVIAIDATEGAFTPAVNDRFLINGAPFNGTGFGFDGTAISQTVNDSMGTPRLTSLMPHFAGYTSAIDARQGGEDESYDTVGPNDMHLAMVPANPGRAIVPSYHRPDLVNYWQTVLNSEGASDSLKTEIARQVMFRPIGGTPTSDHPNFTGSNPNFNPVNGPWDVDNDNDGRPDSIWIDPGLPVLTAPNGRRYKRLVALCIKDMDGRIQVNAHGNQQQTASPGFRPETALSGSFGLATAGSRLPRGTGYGAAEVDFYSLFGSDSNAYNILLNGRYGGDGVPGIAGNDGLSIVRHHGLLNGVSAPHGWYGTVPDTFGRWIVAIDQSGQPIWSRTVLGNTQGEGSDDPYELEFDPQTAVNDTPYTPAELERLLRYNDPDWALLPDRLELAGTTYLAGDTHGSPGAQQQNRELIGTSGSHLPVPETVYPFHQRSQLTGNGAPIGSNTILDLYRTRYASGGITGPALATEFAKVVPWEFRHGQRLDINRWLGDGLDNNGNNVPDEPGTATSPGEPAIPEPAWTDGPAHFGTLPTGYNGQQAYSGNDADANGNGTTGEAADQLFARQLMARQLYCLALLLTNDGFLGNPPAPHEPALGASEKVSLYRRRLAQWAVNVIDFRDADAIMTRFDYDENPWDGWSPDGTFVVWGCEHPDMLLGETLAFHDRRVKDTDKDSTMKKVDQMTGADDDVDQFRVPQGSLFIELLNVRNRFANNNKLPAELYNAMTGALDLGRVPGAGADGLNHPVWQIAISRITRNNGTLANARPSQLSTANPESTSYEPSNMKLVGTALPMPIDRYVWFTPAGGSATDPAAGQRIFYSATSPQLFPGQYAVVGPRQDTILGSLDPAAGMATGLWGGDASQKITLGGGTVTVTDAAGNTTSRTAGTDIGPVVPIIAQLPNPDPLFPNAPGLNVTEPMPVDMNYYPAPPDHMGTPADAYDDPATPTGTFLDEPLDYRAGMPLRDRDMIRTGTYEDVVSIFLQRLADPTRGWHSTENPYITVDWASVDVTVFTGEENTASAPTTPTVPELEPQDPRTRTQAMRFRTRERGWQQTANVPEGNVWPPHTSTPATTTADASATAGTYFNHSLDINNPMEPKHTLGYVNSRVATPVTTPNLGDPSIPFPWLCWNDRPFSNPMELMLVSSSSPERLLAEVTPGPLLAGANAYKQADSPTEANSRSQFIHLMNFFQSSDVVNGTLGADLYRLFDFVETPSPFTHVDRYYNPGVFASSTSFKPPFNRLSKFRDPGRININTISDDRVLKAAIAGMGLDSTTETNLITAMLLSRTGSTTGNWWDFTSNSSVPVRMANPFRPADAADLMPVGSGVDLRQPYPVQATLLRSYDANPTTSALTNPLLGPASAGSGQPSGGRYTGVTDPRLGESPDRNAYFKFQNFQKLGNTFTTHSNVYAVWMTMGYFEVEDNPLAPMATTNVDAGHLDGYRLGQEIGADSGEIVRHRAFYIIDRSIPVGYQTGMRHNTDKAVVLRRFIE